MDVAVPILRHSGADDFRSTTRVDFRSMLMFEANSSFEHHTLRFWETRRADGSKWEYRETPESHEQFRTELVARVNAGDLFARSTLDEFDAEGAPAWRTIKEWQNLEQAYQEFLVELARGNRAPAAYGPFAAAKASREGDLARIARREAAHEARERGVMIAEAGCTPTFLRRAFRNEMRRRETSRGESSL
jgi:hypothetical protein